MAEANITGFRLTLSSRRARARVRVRAGRAAVFPSCYQPSSTRSWSGIERRAYYSGGRVIRAQLATHRWPVPPASSPHADDGPRAPPGARWVPIQRLYTPVIRTLLAAVYDGGREDSEGYAA